MKRLGYILGVAVLAICTASYGAIIVSDGSDGGSFNDGAPPWDEGSALTGSGGDGYVAIVGRDVPLGSHTGALAIDTAATDASVYVDKIFADGDLAGAANGNNNWGSLGGGVEGISFDFYVSSGPLPQVVNIYFRDVDSGYYWFYNVYDVNLNPGDLTVGGWTDSSQMTADFESVGFLANTAFGGGWQNATGPTTGAAGEAAWNSAFGSVDEVGLEIQWQSNAGAGVYGIDNFALHDEPVIAQTPEPGTYMALATALLSMGITFRRRLNHSLAALLKS